MATLFNTKISNTYQGLLKTVDNAAISATLKELSDGSGNQSGLYLNTAGDFKVTSVLEWGSLKDTGTGVTITRYVTSTDGLENFDNNTSLPTSAAVKLYVDTKFATSDTLAEVLSFGNSTSGNDIVVSPNDDVLFSVGGVGIGSSSKAIFGSGSAEKLEISHDGINGYIYNSDTLNITGERVLLKYTDGTAFLIAENNAVQIRHNNQNVIQTTDTGVTITGIISGLTNPIDAQDAATKSYVDALDAGSDLDITDGTNTGAVNLNTQTLSILGTTNEIEAVVSGQGVTIGLPSSISTDLVGNVTGNLTGDVTGGVLGNVTGNLTGDVTGDVTGNLTGNVTGNVAGDLTGNVTATSVLADGVTATTQASTDSSTKVATTAYVKGLDNASDLDFSGDSGTGDVNLNAQTFAITGTANQIESSASNQGLSLQFPSAGVTLPNGSLATTQSADDNSTKVATTSYVDTSAALYLPLAGGIMSGNTIHNDSIKSIYGTGSDAQVYHDGSNFYINNSTGQLNIDQSAVTESIVFKTSDANALDTTALIINRGGDLITGRDVTIAGDLTVNGTTTTVNSQTLSVDDPLISLAINNDANSLDIGYYGKYNDGTTRYLGLFNDASDGNKFKLFKGTTVEPTTTVNIGAAGYAAADLELANLVATGNVTGTTFIGNLTGDVTGNLQGNVTGDVTGNVTGNLTGTVNTTSVLANGVTATTQAANDNSTKVATTAYANAAASAVPIGDYLPLAGGTMTGVTQFNDHTNYGDQVAAKFGASQDLQIYHDGSNSYIEDTGTGNLYVRAATSFIAQGINQSNFIRANQGGGVNLYYNNSNKFDTTSTGINVTGGITVNDTLNSVLELNTSNANCDITMQSVNTSSLTRLRNGTNDFQVHTNGTLGLTIDSSQNATFAGNVLIGTSTSGSATAVSDLLTLGKSGSTSIGVNYTDGTATKWGYIYVNNSKTTYGSFADITFETGSSPAERMRIDSAGNVGIGTTSPSDRLTVSEAGNGNIALFTNTTDADLNINLTSGVTMLTPSTGILALGTSSTERMRIDSAGNVRIGLTSTTAKLTVSGDIALHNSVASGAATNSILFKNSIYEIAQIKAIVGVGQINRGELAFNVDNGGGMGTAMYINRQRNVGIGTSSPNAKLEIIDTSNPDATSGSLIIEGRRDGSANLLTLRARDASAPTSALPNGQGGLFRFQGFDGTDFENMGYIQVAADGQAVANADAPSFMAFGTSADGSSSPTEKMRITSGGNVGIGTTNPEAVLNYKVLSLNGSSGDGGYLRFYSNNVNQAGIYSNDTGFNFVTEGETYQRFYTNGSERMRITSGGGVLIGKTSEVNTGAGLVMYKDAVNGGIIKYTRQDTSVDQAHLVFFTNAGGVVGSVVSTNTSTSFNTSSDYRLKEDLQDFAGLDMVSKIPVYDYKWKSSKDRSYGVMAHELQEVLPDAVSGEKDAEEMQGVDYSKIVPLLVKAIQELKAEIDILKAK